MCPDAQSAAFDLLTAGSRECRDWALVERVLGDLEQVVGTDSAAVHATVQADTWPPAARLVALPQAFVRGQDENRAALSEPDDLRPMKCIRKSSPRM
jgi:hypothetical protein